GATSCLRLAIERRASQTCCQNAKSWTYNKLRLANLAERLWQPGCSRPIRWYNLSASDESSVYIAITLLGGLLSLSLGLFHGQWTEPSRYLCYLALALLASGMKVNLPGVDGTMSVIFLFILIGVRELTLAQTF